jgi:hypothetical protein
LSDEEIAMLRELSLAKNGELDPAINSVIHALCKRGFVDGEAEGEDVDFSNSLKSALSEESPEGSKIRLEQKTKFWEAERIGTSVHVVYGKKNSKGQSNVHNAASIEAAKVWKRLFGCWFLKENIGRITLRRRCTRKDEAGTRPLMWLPR